MKIFDIKQPVPIRAIHPDILGQNNKKGTLTFRDPPHIVGHYSVAGKKEGQGPLGHYFDHILPDSKIGEDTYEKAECSMFIDAIDGAVERAGISEADIDFLVGGDLLDQIVSANYAARCYAVPYLGVYNACATSCETLTLASMMISGGFASTVACCTGSHFAAAERQYRGPLELGAQKAPYSQWTVTGGGCCVLADGGSGARVTGATVGRVIDYGIVDLTNMSAAMAPAAADTLERHFVNTGTGPEDYDRIVTGDLGKLGEDIVRELMKRKGFEMGNFIDCGHMMYRLEQNMSQGGSGAGCSMSALTAYFLPKLERGEYKKILLCATGALMNTVTNQQGESIPCIAHAIVLEAD